MITDRSGEFVDSYVGMSESSAIRVAMDGDLEQLGERIEEQAAYLDAVMQRSLTDLGEFDETGGWHVQGADSWAHCLAWQVGWGSDAVKLVSQKPCEAMHDNEQE
jgi:hypothetical protein